MKVRVLGCGGGIGGWSARTTALLVDDDILIDAGTGLAELTLAELAAIDHVFLTHSHLDHIAALPLMIDAVADLRRAPVVIHATPPTLRAVRGHIFNGDIWPDFSRIAIRERLVMRCEAIRVGRRVALGHRAVAAVPARHTVPAVGYRLDSGQASLVFTGDTAENEAFWPAVNRIANLRYLIVETSFSDAQEPLARASGHLCPRLLLAGLARLAVPAQVYVAHMKPGQAEAIARELEAAPPDLRPTLLRDGQVFEF
ncbi:MAG: 3',5'-cyclic-nucleotide phosphodiesterase [Candidatus Accumulibacter sp.]|jgi:ribonuclease BN (tRNA processing enzyme)|nr:3',5'-cyclic-nucleotide phosphodiesterase [Accumulibacter sp.]